MVDVGDPLQAPQQDDEAQDVQLFEEVPRHGESPTAEGGDSTRPSRFAFDARTDSPAALDDDPLGSSAFSAGDPLSGEAGMADPLGDPLGDPLSRGGASGDGSEVDIPLHDEGTTRIDTFASYGQLLTDDYVRNGSRFGHSSQEGAEADAFGHQPDESGQQHEAEPLQPQASPAPSSRGSSRGGPASTPPPVQRTPPPVQRTGRDGQSRPVTGPPSRRRITVGDPIKKMEGSMFPGMKNGYVLYRVDSQDAEHGTHTSVRRRFRDFVSLADLLKSSHRGYFLPPRPEKQPNPLEAQVPDSEFVASRCAALEVWLRRLSAHPVIGHSQELRLFLEKEGQLGGDPQWLHLQPAHGGVLDGLHRLPRQLLGWQTRQPGKAACSNAWLEASAPSPGTGTESSVPSAAEAAQSTRRTGDLLRRIKEQTTSMKHHPPPSEAELDLLAKKERLEDWGAVLADASRHAESLALAFEDAGARTGDVGMALIRLGRFQDEDGPGRPGRYTPAGAANSALAAHAIKTGKAAVVVARVAKAASGPVTDALEPLHEALAMAPAAGKALRQREEALLSVQALRDEAEAKADSVAQLEAEGSQTYGTHYGKTRKAQALSDEVKALQEAGQAAQAEYERVRDRNIEELDRWRRTRSEDFASMLAGLATVQHAFHKRAAGVWQAVAADLSGERGDGGGRDSGGAGFSRR